MVMSPLQLYKAATHGLPVVTLDGSRGEQVLVALIADKGLPGQLLRTLCSELGTEVVTLGREEVVAFLRKTVAGDEPRGVVLLDGGFRGGYWARALEELKKSGINYHRVRYVNLRLESALAGGVKNLLAYLKALVAYLRASGSVSEAAVRLTLSKRLDRRSLLRYLPASVIAFASVPVVKERECCLYPSCSLCVASCREGAIEADKPVYIIGGKCVECGACVPACPVGALEAPDFVLKGFESLVKTLASEEVRANLVVTCSEGREALYRFALSGLVPAAPTFVFEVYSCVACAHQAALLYAALSGIRMVLYCPLGQACRKAGALARCRRLVEELGKVIKLKDSVVLAEYDLAILETMQKPAALPIGELPAGIAHASVVAARLLPSAEAPADLSVAHFYLAEVDPGRCSLCGACSKACPTGALRVAEDPEESAVSLMFSAGGCVGCGSCSTACPEGALRVLGRFDPRAHSSDAPMLLVRVEVARCRSCGAVLGPVALLRATERRMRSAGVPEAVIKALWYCGECKYRAWEGGRKPEV